MELRFLLAPAVLLEYTFTLASGGTGSSLPAKLSLPRELLILDDLGAGKVTDRGVELLFMVLDMRMVRRAPLWITSNLTVKELGAWIMRNDPSQQINGQRIVRRLYEMCPDNAQVSIG
jgi:DNA replication protein DnaC